MARRKKGNKLNLIIIVLVLVIGAWFAADFYFNVWTKKPARVFEPESAQTASKENEPAKQETAPAQENGFKTDTYRDERFGFEFQYPVPAKDDPQCAKIVKSDDGFTLGIFSLYVGERQGLLQDYVNEQLNGMNIEKRETLAVAGQPAVKIDYQTTGMGWYGSDTFVEHNGKVFDFGLLANEATSKCAGIDDYEDRIYLSVLSTLKFTN